MGHIVNPSTLIILIYGLVVCEAFAPTVFGSKGQYACHCDQNAPCDTTSGQCPAKCDKGWFGLACQYQDLVTISGATITTTPTSVSSNWLTDRDDATCNEDTSLESINVRWNLAYPVHWLRVQTNIPGQGLSLTFSFTTKTNQQLTCSNQQTYTLDNVTIDYRCDVNETVQEVTISGPGVQSLCSLYISGGRNFALRQKTEQSGNLLSSYMVVYYTSNVAVDGNTDSVFDHKSCTHTTTTRSITTANWTVIFDAPKEIDRVVIYNRADCCSERLQYFNMTFLDETNSTVWVYEDTGDTALIYNIIPSTVKTTSGVRISTYPSIHSSYPIVSLCEVFAFGECIAGTWGLNCTDTCPDNCRTSCHADTGLCPISVP